MTAVYQYENVVEERQHLAVTHRLAQDLDMRVKDIQEIYEEFLGSVKPEARIKDYLVILVSRQVRDSFRSGGRLTD